MQQNREQSSAVYIVDSFANGIAFGQFQSPKLKNYRDSLCLRIDDEVDLAPLRSRFVPNKVNLGDKTRVSPLQQLEAHLIRLSRHGILRRSLIIFGCYTDPFHPFQEKFDVSMRFLDLFQRYVPGLLVVQTRSPLLTIALPVLKRLGSHVTVAVSIETNSAEMAARYTPNLPRIDERIKLIKALRRFGVQLSINVSPVLPYGEWKNDAGAFADLLVENADYINIQPFLTEETLADKRLKNHSVIVRMSEDRRFHWLRHDAAVPLITEVEKRSPQKLLAPVYPQFEEKQLQIFAA